MKAFPTTKPLDSWDDPNQGMDLRDYFAAKAMQKITWKKGEEAEDAEDCYVIADAMMKARDK
jgi:hypothetical protein